MPLDATPEERARAVALVHDKMLHELWVRVLFASEDPLESADIEAHSMLENFEESLGNLAGRDADVTRHLAIEHMEAAWRSITAELESLDGPIPYVPVPDADRPPEIPVRKRPFSSRDEEPDQ